MKKLKTYSEQEDESYFDWNKALSEKRINTERWIDLADKSESWVTCACGNQCDIIDRGYKGEPYDNTLKKLGVLFHKNILKKKKSQAKKTLHKIEQRSKQLIKMKVIEMRKKTKEYESAYKRKRK